MKRVTVPKGQSAAGRPRTESLRRARWVVAGLLVTLVAGGCAGATTRVAVAGAGGPTTTGASSVTTTTASKSNVAPCTAANMGVQNTLYPLGGGTDDIVIGLKNQGVDRCTLTGYPSVSLDPGIAQDGSGITSSMPHVSVTDTKSTANLPPGVPAPDPMGSVSIQPAQSAVFFLVVNTHCSGGVTAVTLHVGLPDNGGSVIVPSLGLSCLLHGVAVSPFIPMPDLPSLGSVVPGTGTVPRVG